MSKEEYVSVPCRIELDALSQDLRDAASVGNWNDIYAVAEKLDAILSRATLSDEVGAIGELKKLLHTMCQYKWESDKYQGRYVVHSFAADLGTILSSIGQGESIFDLISAAKYSLVIDQSEETVSLKFGGHTHNSSGIEILLEFDKTSAPRVVTDRCAALMTDVFLDAFEETQNYLHAIRRTLIAFATSLPATVPDGEVRLWDTQWMSIVNHDNCYRDWSKDDAIAHAVKMTEQAIARNVADGKLPPNKTAAAPQARERG